jgi:outer membrane lipoprotein-sorting protein
VLTVVLAPLVATMGRQGSSPAVGLLAQSVQAMSNLQSVHIKARMRTIPRDNFEYINAACDWVPLEIWKQFGEMPKWRVEKTGGRVVVMDGVTSVMFAPPKFASQGGPRAGYLDWMKALLEPEQIMESELAAARAGKSSAALTEDAGELVLTMHRNPGGSGDWLFNKSVSSSNQTRVYRFDKGTKRLTGMQLIVHAAGGDASVFEILGVTYNEPVDPALFTLTLPEDVVRDVSSAEMPTANRPLPQSPKEAAQILFDALSREDWELARTIWPRSGFSGESKRANKRANKRVETLDVMLDIFELALETRYLDMHDDQWPMIDSTNPARKIPPTP